MAEGGMVNRVAFSTFGLTLIVTVLATVIIAVVFQALGVEVATLREVMISCAIMCLILSPPILGPLVWLTCRYRRLSNDLRRIALTDPLTGLPNRRAFFQEVRERLGQAGQPRQCALLMIDVDRFKDVNDRFGHDAGDAALVHIAREFDHVLTGVDAVTARLGGEEFAIFLDLMERDIAQEVARALCAGHRASSFYHEGQRVPLSISIGLWSGHASDIDGPLARADAAVYIAKSRGRDRCELALTG
jgi:diguanylate cyclase (GGDEF)-like protein